MKRSGRIAVARMGVASDSGAPGDIAADVSFFADCGVGDPEEHQGVVAGGLVDALFRWDLDE